MHQSLKTDLHFRHSPHLVHNQCHHSFLSRQFRYVPHILTLWRQCRSITISGLVTINSRQPLHMLGNKISRLNIYKPIQQFSVKMEADQMTMFNDVDKLLTTAWWHRLSIALQQLNHLCNVPRILLSKSNTEQTTCINALSKQQHY